MHHVNLRTPVLDIEGLLFYITRLSNSISDDGPIGVWINSELVQKNPILRKVIREEFIVYFIAIDPLRNSQKGSLAVITHNLLQHFQKGTEKGTQVPVHVYVELKENDTRIKELLEKAIDLEKEPSEIKTLVHKILSIGYDCTRVFIDNLRHKFDQYWFTYPTIFDWFAITYFSKDREKWYAMNFGESIEIENWGKDHRHSRNSDFENIFLRMINADDLPELAEPQTLLPQTLSEEMIATALIDLSKGRTRSSIFHGVIALEAATKQAFEKLLNIPISEFPEAAVIDAVSREVSLSTLSQVVYSCTSGVKDLPEIDWDKIKLICTTRNTIVHKGQRKLPKFESVKEQLIEIYKYVNGIESLYR